MYKTHKLTTISVSYENYSTLKKLGSTGDSFNDVLTEVLKKITKQQTESGLTRLNQSAAVENLLQPQQSDRADE